MNKDAFWALVQEAKTTCNQDLDTMEDYLREQLVSVEPAAVKSFHDILQTYKDLADQCGLWDAISVTKEYGCSDNGSIDFHAWLVIQGKEVYMNMLRDPDTLVDIEPYGDRCFGCLSYVGDYVYKQLTDRSAYDGVEPNGIEKIRDELRKDIVYKDGTQYPREPKDPPRFLSRLYEKYSGPERFLAASSTWNYNLYEIRRLLDEGEVRGMATKKEKGGGAR